MELVQGMQNKRELTLLRKTMRNWNAKILYINEDISTKAMFFVERHFLSHSIVCRCIDRGNCNIKRIENINVKY